MLNYHAEATCTSNHFKIKILNHHKVRASVILNGDYKTHVISLEGLIASSIPFMKEGERLPASWL